MTLNVRLWWKAAVGIVIGTAYDVCDEERGVSLGLGGDGDEIAAITEVERRFGVRLDYVDARHWVTVGDVFTALKQALPSEQANDSGTWLLFAKAISNETGVDPEQVTSDTLLLGKALFDMRIVLVVASILGVSLAIVRYM